MKKQAIKVGDIFGYLVILKKYEDKKKKHKGYYICKCVCEQILIVRGSSLKNKNTKSCGCLRRKLAKAKRLTIHGECSYNQLQYNYKTNSKNNDHEYNLTIQDLKKIVNQLCFYCLCEPRPYNKFFKIDKTRTNSNKSVSDEWANKQWIMVNEIVKIDDKLGYTVSNCIPCCMTCKKMKSNYSLEEFIIHIRKILNYYDFKSSKI